MPPGLQALSPLNTHRRMHASVAQDDRLLVLRLKREHQREAYVVVAATAISVKLSERV